MIRLSIIIPTFNSSKTIFDTLESIRSQTFQNLEVLIMDGKSNDDTIEIVKQYKLVYPKIKYYSEIDNGVYDAMNKGIEIAQGDYLYFLGSDDLLFDKKTLKDVFDKIDEEDFVYGNVKFKHSKKIHSGKSSYEKLTYYQVSICHQAIFYSKRIFEIIGNYNDRFFIHADHDFNIRCFENKNLSKIYIKDIVAIFNENGLSGVSSNSDGYRDYLTKKIIEETDYLKKLILERDKLRRNNYQIKKSTSFKLGNFIVRPFFLIWHFFLRKINN